jgi:hypothetical protein
MNRGSGSDDLRRQCNASCISARSAQTHRHLISARSHIDYHATHLCIRCTRSPVDETFGCKGTPVHLWERPRGQDALHVGVQVNDGRAEGAVPHRRHLPHRRAHAAAHLDAALSSAWVNHGHSCPSRRFHHIRVTFDRLIQASPAVVGALAAVAAHQGADFPAF